MVSISQFFSDFERFGNALDTVGVGKLYASTFQFADPSGVKVVERDKFLAILPKRKSFFNSVGLKSTKITSLDEKTLDENFILIEVHMVMHFERSGHDPIDHADSATFILRRAVNGFEIVFQLEHQEMMKKVVALGLLD